MALALLLPLVSTWLAISSGGEALATIKAEEVALPEALGTVTGRGSGTTGEPFIFIIGEEHVSLKVQQAVADILRYLHGAYDVALVCIEGYDKSLVTPSAGASLIAQRSVARSDLAGRRISAAEYFARAYPDVPVIGVENMVAYQAHGKELDKGTSLEREAKQWEEDFQKFLTDDLGNLRVSADDAHKVEDSLKIVAEKQDFGPFTQAVFDIVGKQSVKGKKLSSLNERREALERAAKSAAKSATTDSPEMQARDGAMVAATLRTIKEKGSSVAVLVVGKLHMSGVEKLLSAKKIPYASIVPAGAEDKTEEKLSDEDEKVYQEWRAGKITPLESWLAHFKPQPASARSGFEDATILLGVLATGDRLRRQGVSETEALAIMRQSPLPSRVRVDRVFDIRGGQGIEFTANGKKGYAYFAEDGNQLNTPGGPTPIQTGEAGGRYYAVYGGGDSMQPPIPPAGGGGGGITNPPSDDFHPKYLLAIAVQKKQMTQRATIRFSVERGIVVRWVDDKPKAVLAVTLSELKELVREYENAKLGPDRVFAAQKLADTLLIELNEQLEEGRRELVQISQDDMIGDVNLTLVQELAANRDASHLRSIDWTKVYTIPWAEAQQDLSAVGRPIRDEKSAEKAKAMEEIRKDTDQTSLKDVLSRNLEGVKAARLEPAIKTIARATRAG